MDFPEQVIQTLQSHIRTLNETQVVAELRAVEALQEHEREMVARLKPISLESTEDSTGEINQLGLELNLYRRPPFSTFPLFEYIEEALKKRLEELRKRPDNNSEQLLSLYWFIFDDAHCAGVSSFYSLFVDSNVPLLCGSALQIFARSRMIRCLRTGNRSYRAG